MVVSRTATLGPSAYYPGKWSATESTGMGTQQVDSNASSVRLSCSNIKERSGLDYLEPHTPSSPTGTRDLLVWLQPNNSNRVRHMRLTKLSRYGKTRTTNTP